MRGEKERNTTKKKKKKTASKHGSTEYEATSAESKKDKNSEWWTGRRTQLKQSCELFLRSYSHVRMAQQRLKGRSLRIIELKSLRNLINGLILHVHAIPRLSIQVNRTENSTKVIQTFTGATSLSFPGEIGLQVIRGQFMKHTLETSYNPTFGAASEKRR